MSNYLPFSLVRFNSCVKAHFVPPLVCSLLFAGSFLLVEANNAGATVINLLSNSVYEADVQVGAVPGDGADQSFTTNPVSPDPLLHPYFTVITWPDGHKTAVLTAEGTTAAAIINTVDIGTTPSGNAGPPVDLTVNTGIYQVIPGAGVPPVPAGGITAAVQGVSKGSNGGNGGNAYVLGNGGAGHTGANGGLVTVTLNGKASAINGAGLVALSLAGNGGNGGGSYGLGGSSGSGGLGGNGGDATANLTGTGSSVSTTGNSSVGLLAFSQGGNGGQSGGGFGLFAYSSGGGGGAGQAGQAIVYTDAGTSITTGGDLQSSDYSYGIEARSIGGGGGSSSGGFGLFYSGGSGGSTGGDGGAAQITARGSITTHGNYAQGIFAQSIGGGGGDAGKSISAAVALGGDGSAGGSGGTVEVGVAGTGHVTTSGLGANAIEAQSIGGSGGNGANSGALFSLGGKGSGTTKGGTVSVSNSGTLTTAGEQAAGILAQSIGGGGGNGGTAAGLFTAGGSGGSGADGGTVTVINGGNISAGTNGLASASSPGILAQSIGGGGGNGGGAISVGPGISAAFGGDGAGGGKGGSVTIRRDNTDPLSATAYSINTYGDQSSAVVAQSIGGGGGNGGFTVSASANPVLSIAIGVAGNGGFGGDGGEVSVGTKGTLSTVGSNSDGILAQSIGGGGGNGGFSVAGSAGIVGIAVGVGGKGGTGGNALGVTVSNLSNISTVGANSYGIAAQSIGGGGGNGGFTAGGSIGLASVSVGVGGEGASGGASGTVTVNSSGSILTWRDNSTGILAQSLGGGGGNGGFSAVGSLSLLGSVSVGVGGSGGGGQVAGNVDVTADGAGQSILGSQYTLVTFGQNADGILAQSIGGGGGNGGFAGTLALSGSASAGISLGGSGGIGNSAGTVSVTSGNSTLHNNIFTGGDNSNGILAQSIGGGGGNGGFAASLSGSLQGLGSAAVTLGGSGGSGATGNSVIVNSVGNITTLGDMSDAIFAQSVGGGGGNGGFSAALSASTGSFGGAVAIGGSGSGGGNGGSVTVNSTGDIETSGMQSSGIFAQSVGGGGGNGGFAGSGALTFGGVSAAVGLGGDGSSGGDGSTVDVTSIGNITTTGDQASAIIAQSVGGGGGNGGSTIGLSLGSAAGASVNIGGKGDSGGSAAAVTVHSTGNLSTGTEGVTGNDAYGILAQSIGGGGGNGGFSGNITFGGLAGIGVSVGGSGGSGGSAGLVVVTGSGNISTLFDNSSGILAQSLGGGGGNGGFSFSAAGSAAFEGIGAAGAVSVGGFGGTAGASSDVMVTNTGTIYTKGFNSNGIEAQSLGGGGGNGGLSVSGAFTVGAVGIGVSVGGFGAGGGDAGAVTVNSYGTTGLNSPVYGITTLETDGDQSNGIFAQSLGGGGGNGGFSATIGVALQGAAAGVSVGGFATGGGGKSETVSVTSYNNILTLGDKSNGILAQSIGGGGGNGGFSIGLSGGSEFGGSVSIGGKGSIGGDASSVTVQNYGTIWTKGADSNGIEAQSLGGGGGNGGFSIAGAFTTGSAALGLSVGGFGAGGGDADAVEVDSYAQATAGIPLLIAPEAGVVTLETDGARSNGIMAQSIGGGGGNGGFSGGLSASTSGGAFTASVGGFGSAAGDAGMVTVTSYNNILTKGVDSNGILAQSLGGGGGNGGFSIGLTAGSKFAGTLSIGGFSKMSGGGGDGKTVTVNNVGTIKTGGDRSNGIEAQSIGGSGGNGGFSLAGSFALGNAGLGASIGGSGSAGGLGGVVNVNSTNSIVDNIATIETTGQSANGIEAQSIGGGGGNGGFSGAFTATTDAQASLSLSVGGFGAAGNSAGAVDVISVDNILTHADGSNGILAQSVGGGGGNGGFSFAGTLSVPEGNSFSLSASLGGFGGLAGDAGTVTVASTGIISTLGNHADGVVAQSLGGGGGNGGLSVAGTFNFASSNNVPSITASVGGFGGSGGAGKAVGVTRIGDTSTIGDASVGILAQSIGGGGGNGGLSVAGSIGGPDSKQISASVGGFGGVGSEAGTVTVNNTGNISTGSSSIQQQQVAELGTIFQPVTVVTGKDSDGILAQSIGGGGGNGGFSFSGAVGPTGEDTNVNVGLTVGGFGGDGGFGSNVSVTNNGEIQTIGPSANGIKAQSIGGGGGNGGGAFTGLLAGGDAQAGKAINVAVSVGGMGGIGNTAGDVLVNQYGGILTSGAGSNGIFAQSIGGGGGNGGGANSLSLQLATSCTFDHLGLGKVITSVKAAKNPSVNVQVDVGGFGGTGNDAGNVTVNNHDFITTTGKASVGIKAQSIGGGGGDGGQAIVGLNGMFPGAEYVDYAITAVTFPISTTGLIQGAGRVTVGGHGGASGGGLAVNVTNNGFIQTSGSDSYGIEAQSIGGGGGNGGNASSGFTGLVSIGGFEGAKGNGGEVTVTNTPSLTSTADISTTGNSSAAIFAQSVGGGGGNGGSAGGLLSLGGFGGASGNGGTVSVKNDATLLTTGDKADGIIAQSLGGGGGNGGSSGLSGITLGGYGGASGDGGSVTVTNSSTAKIQTEGFASVGIFAQSVGGGGGLGGGKGKGAITIGGSGSGGGNGGTVKIYSYGTLTGDTPSIITKGDDAIGLFGESIGGGGGKGGSTFISAVAVGGSGGSSGNGGEVDITNTAWISTSGKRSDAIRAQSTGGGGGSAGGVSDPDFNGLGLIVSVGGSGSGGGTGGLVSVDNANKLYTAGNEANGIFAHSIGGGGGTGGGAIGAIAVGGSGGQYGDGGVVNVINRADGTIWTRGSMSNGIFAQSVGGGGGYGGGNSDADLLGFKTIVGGNGSGGNGGMVTVGNYGLIETDGFASQAILAQSIGGGGGSAGVAGSAGTDFSAESRTVSVGGSGGSGGDGGAVIVNNFESGTLVTNGANSTAIFAQSVGGGGGNGGGALTTIGGIGTASVTLGGNGGAGGNGGNVTVVNNGLVQINANNSIGIMAQSVGGGGGTAGSALGVAVVPVAIGGQNSVSGTGGDVSVTNTGSIIIDGDNSVGIFAQSVGGGGGLVQPGGGASSLALLNGGIGTGGIVTINNTAGSITVTGANSIALYSQSVGGGGGAVGLASDPPGQKGAFLFSGSSGGFGAASLTTINQTGNLIAHGVNSIALTAQSDAPDGDGNIIVNILNGATPSHIEGGSGQGAGVYILNGADNQLNNDGIITTVLGVDGFAVRADTGNDNIDNFGTIIGSVDLGAGANSFYNEVDAVFNSGVTVFLGAGNLLTNEGLLSPGDCEHVLTTDLTGNFVQTANGTYLADLDLKNQITDRLNVSGTADVSGTIAVNLVDPLTAPGYALPGQHTNVLISAAGGLTHSGITLQAPDTAVSTYSLLYPPNGTDIDLGYVIDYSPSGLTPNQHSVGSAINQIQLAQISPAFRPVATALFFQPDVATLGRIYDSLSGEGTSALQQAGFVADDIFLKTIAHRKEFWLSNDSHDVYGNSLLSTTGGPRGASRNWRAWITGNSSKGTLDGDRIVGSAKANDSGDGFVLGIDEQLSSSWLIGVAGGYGRMSFNVHDRETNGHVDAWHIAGYGAMRQDHFYLTGTLAYDYFNNKELRHASIPDVSMDTPCGESFTIPGFDEYLTGAFHSYSLSGDIEAGYKQQLNTVEVTPFAGLRYGSMHMSGFSETNMAGGLSPIGLSYNDRIIDSMPLRLGIQLKTKTEFTADTALSLVVSAAWKHEFRTERSTESSFVSAPGFDFVIQGAHPPVDSMLASIGLNLTVSKVCTLFGNFECDALGTEQSYAGMAGFHINW